MNPIITGGDGVLVTNTCGLRVTTKLWRKVSLHRYRSSTNRTAHKLKRSSSDDGKVSPTAAYQDSFRKCSSFFDEMEAKQYYPICQHFVTNHMKTNIISFLF